jgi:hypothetical protein
VGAVKGQARQEYKGAVTAIRADDPLDSPRLFHLHKLVLAH